MADTNPEQKQDQRQGAATHWVVIATSLAALGLGWWQLSSEPPAVERLRLSPQACLANCQGSQTDCVLACEGRSPCEEQCLGQGRRCADGCRREPPPVTAPAPGTARDAGHR